MRPAAEWLSSLSITIALAAAPTLALASRHPDIPTPATTLGFAISGCLGAILLMPQSAVRIAGRTLHPSAWAPVCTAGLMLAGGLQESLTIAPMLNLGIAMLLILMLFTRVQLALREHLGEPSAAAVTSLMLLLITASPIVLGPLAARFSETRWLIDVAVNLSPLSYFAGVLGFDYLRSNWFYEHLNLGSMRFQYMSPMISGIIVAFAAATLTLATHRSSRQTGAAMIRNTASRSPRAALQSTHTRTPPP